MPYAVPMRHVQRNVDTEVLSRRCELQVLGFSHQAQEVSHIKPRRCYPAKEKKKPGRSCSGSVHMHHLPLSAAILSCSPSKESRVMR